MKAVDGVAYARRLRCVQLKQWEDAIAPAPATETTRAAARRFQFIRCQSLVAMRASPLASLRHAQSLGFARRTGADRPKHSEKVGLCVPCNFRDKCLHEAVYEARNVRFCERDGAERASPYSMFCPAPGKPVH